MDDELRSLLYVIIKNQCEMKVMLEDIEIETKAMSQKPIDGDPAWEDLKKRTKKVKKALAMSLFKESVLEAKIISAEKLGI